MIFEGLNVLQAGASGRGNHAIVSDFFDFSIYVDADEADIEDWYVERFRLLQRSVFQRPGAYFRGYRDLPPDEAERVAAVGRLGAAATLMSMAVGPGSGQEHTGHCPPLGQY